VTFLPNKNKLLSFEELSNETFDPTAFFGYIVPDEKPIE